MFLLRACPADWFLISGASLITPYANAWSILLRSRGPIVNSGVKIIVNGKVNGLNVGELWLLTVILGGDWCDLTIDSGESLLAFELGLEAQSVL